MAQAAEQAAGQPAEVWLRQQAERSRAAAGVLRTAGTAVKDGALARMAGDLWAARERVLEANAADLAAARVAGLPGPLVKRLSLDEKKVRAMADGLLALVALPDPVGEGVALWRRPNGLVISQVRVPLGVVGMIYEARPNVTVDAAGICLKTGNAVLLRGGKEALRSNQALVEVLRGALAAAGLPEDAVQLLADPSREAARAMMRLTGWLDVLIPRGGAGLIRTVMENATVPVIETGTGNCHVYVDREADLAKALPIVLNAKLSNPAVCNAAEKLLVDRAVAAAFLPGALSALAEAGVEVRGCPETVALWPGARAASAEDWDTEFLDLIIGVRVVNGVEEAVDHINRHGTRHSEAIVTENYTTARRFLEGVDAAAVYVNASTRFTDGGEFGFGAEIGISTQKLHARGPMGLKELTTTKYLVYGDGQVRG